MTSQSALVAKANSNLTPAQRRQARVAAEREERARAEAEFLRTADQAWQVLWARATRLALCIAGEPACREQYSWWFDDFDVNPRAQTFRCETEPKTEVSRATLTFDLSKSVDECLATGQSYFDEFVERKERERREAEALVARKNTVLAKLTEEERKLLNLPAKFYC